MILVLGDSGFLGKAVCKNLTNKGIPYIGTSLSKGCDLQIEQEFSRFLGDKNVDKIINCAAFSGGLQFAMSNPVDLFHKNISIISTMYKVAHEHGIKRIVNPISNCVYPAKATLFKEEELWDGPLHESVYIYGFTRRAEIALGWAYRKQYGMESINVVCSNMYGPGDHFDLLKSHALGASIMKFVEAARVQCPTVIVWGTGKPVREWLYVDDAAEALVRGLYIRPYDDIINLGTGKGISMKNLVELIAHYTNYNGEIIYDTSKADGAEFKTVDGTRGRELLGYTPQTSLEEGIIKTISWYKEYH